MTMRTVVYISSTRADYGIARWVLHDLGHNPNVQLRLVITGTHLDRSFGETRSEIVADGLTIDREVPVDFSGDSPIETSRWMAACLVGLTEALIDLNPDVVLIVGDRFEALLAAQAASLCRIPVAHIHGGEITHGSLDDSMRHAITKLSHVHFAAAPEYGRRIVQLGEDPSSVHVVGSPGLCAIDREKSVPDDELAAILGFAPSEPFVIATYHPSTAEDPGDSLAGVVAMVDALAKMIDMRVVITGVNVDPGFEKHREVLRSFADGNPNRVSVIESLGHRRYLAALQRARLCIGNSSSGVIEAPSLGTPTVNIGNRQAGRLRAASVIDAAPDVDSVRKAIDRALSTDFAQRRASGVFPYVSSGASNSIARILATCDLSDVCVKSFHDCGAECDSWTAVAQVNAYE